VKVTAIVSDLETASFSLDDQGSNPSIPPFSVMSINPCCPSTMRTKTMFKLSFRLAYFILTVANSQFIWL
jgi:hypothetical protein